MTRPIAFLTDYGLADGFVGVCRGVIYTIAPDSVVIDLTHQVPRQNVLQGAVILSRAVAFMPTDAVYLAVVDPGVGSERRSVALEASSGALLVGPDNGVLSMAWEQLGGVRRAFAIEADDVVLHPVSKTFHGRDVFAPAAAHLAAGMPIERLGPELAGDELISTGLPGAMVVSGVVGARVVGVDGFGNVQLNITPADLEAAGLRETVAIGPREVPRAATFTDVPEGSLALIADSQGFVALVVNRGSAAQALGLAPGATVTLGRPSA